jgi:aminoglycoside 6'-N-acetyltransferase
VSLPILHGDRVTLRPLRDDDVEVLAEAAISEPSIRPWWGTVGDAEKVRDDMRFDGTALAVEADGALAGWLAFEQETDPDWRHASLDILMLPAFQDRGLGRDALRTAIRWLIDDHGHHRFTIDPAVGNARAIRAYEALGFRRVGVLRQADPDPAGGWRDALLLDLLAEELT